MISPDIYSILGGTIRKDANLIGRPLGYKFHVFCPEPNSTAGKIADVYTQVDYDDAISLKFAASVDCITFEF